jgi:hypothetical protein
MCMSLINNCNFGREINSWMCSGIDQPEPQWETLRNSQNSIETCRTCFSVKVVSSCCIVMVGISVSLCCLNSHVDATVNILKWSLKCGSVCGLDLCGLVFSLAAGCCEYDVESCGSIKALDCLSLKMGPVGRFDTSVNNCHQDLRSSGILACIGSYVSVETIGAILKVRAVHHYHRLCVDTLKS